MARIVGHAGAVLAPEWFTIAPIEVIKPALKKTGLAIGDIEAVRVTEAFELILLAINRLMRTAGVSGRRRADRGQFSFL